MSEGIRVLLSNLWFPSRDGVVKGVIFLENGKIGFIGETPEPEHELSELQYDFQGHAIALHGFSAIVDLVEYPFRRLGINDFSTLSRDELERLAEVGFANALANGITMPIVYTEHLKPVEKISRELGIKVVIIHEGEVVEKSGLYYLLVKEGNIYFNDEKIGVLSDITCSPQRITEKCRIMDLRSTGSTISSLSILYESGVDSGRLYRILVEPYRITRVGEGVIDVNEIADLQVIDLGNPLKASIIRHEDDFWATVSRFMDPDIVFVNGESYYERGEHLVVPVKNITGILDKISIK
ncbi:hypothetical protein [Desulfurococcus amylolyticus]|uniref:Uncharacterized protein n=1 Tax=Desulfurococcus amylolyticus DSM 16532 TaxID=768672 RepID=I3XSP3_DESAM|nr:hypothetical protein [Desulfurococcus amylolyticus]AFL66967.1 hypothetical protein Desfe_1095 [Desulfurococcus amylolyticus DSM 16532]